MSDYTTELVIRIVDTHSNKTILEIGPDQENLGLIELREFADHDQPLLLHSFSMNKAVANLVINGLVRILEEYKSYVHE